MPSTERGEERGLSARDRRCAAECILLIQEQAENPRDVIAAVGRLWCDRPRMFQGPYTRKGIRVGERRVSP